MKAIDGVALDDKTLARIVEIIPREDKAGTVGQDERNMQTIGMNVRKLRKDLDWSQERLANEADMDRTYIGYVENAIYNVTIGALCSLANALKVDVNDLLKD